MEKLSAPGSVTPAYFLQQRSLLAHPTNPLLVPVHSSVLACSHDLHFPYIVGLCSA
ncbi:MAG TPA: hypothetical protein V6D14_13600 [Coleofasciculaceae cyanobacterium]